MVLTVFPHSQWHHSHHILFQSLVICFIFYCTFWNEKLSFNSSCLDPSNGWHIDIAYKCCQMSEMFFYLCCPSGSTQWQVLVFLHSYLLVQVSTSFTTTRAQVLIILCIHYCHSFLLAAHSKLQDSNPSENINFTLTLPFLKTSNSFHQHFVF